MATHPMLNHSSLSIITTLLPTSTILSIAIVMATSIFTAAILAIIFIKQEPFEQLITKVLGDL
jgi:hypothetical protein